MNDRKLQKIRIIWGIALAAAWTSVICLLARFHGDLDVDALLRTRPDDPFLAALCMLGLFLLKSLDFIMHSGVLFATDGIMFSLPAALLLNLIGILIMVTPFYLLGRAFGPKWREQLLSKYPKLRAATQLAIRPNWLRVMLIRLLGPPLLAANLYLGVEACPYGSYLLGSALGILPQMLCFTVMGMKITQPGSTEFRIAVLVQIGEFVISLLLYRRLLNRKKKNSAKS